jgi:hypothetical protein
VALAQCLGSQGKYELALKHAQAAKELYSNAFSQRNSADCEVLLQELFQHQQSARP